MLAAIVESATSGLVLHQDVALPEPGAGEVRVRVAATGVCGSDLHIVDGEYQPITYPVIPGHEFAGMVESSADPRLPVGSRVAVDPSLACGECRFCRAGRSNLCLDGGGLGSTGDGSFAEYVNVPAKLCYLLPNEVSYTDACLAEPLSCVLHAFDVLGSVAGARVLVTGAGAMGALTVWVAGQRGAASVAVSEPQASRAERALKVGAREIVDLAAEPDRRWDIVLECSGHEAAIKAAIGVVDRGGRYLQIGVAKPDVSVPLRLFDLYRDELTILGSRTILRSYGPALEMLAKAPGLSEVLVTHRYPLAEIEQAIANVRRSDGLKTLVVSDPGLVSL